MQALAEQHGTCGHPPLACQGIGLVWKCVCVWMHVSGCDVCLTLECDVMCGVICISQ